MKMLSKCRFLLLPILTLLINSERFVYCDIPPREAFQFIFENNFEDDQLGDYLYGDYYYDWNHPQGTTRQSEVDILSEGDIDHGKYMRGYFPEGTHGQSNCGWSWNTELPGSNTELYFSYDLRFKPDFKWVLGGKLPGLIGGNGDLISGLMPSYTDGFIARTIWADEGKLVFYVYHQDRKTIYGDPYLWNNFKFVSGKWYNLTFRLVLNTVTNNVGNNDGILEGFIDGKLMIQLTNFRFRNYDSIKIDLLSICSFFGGNEAIFNSQRDEWIDTDNYVVYQFSNNVLGVPRGQELSSGDKTLLHPYHDFLDTDWKNSFKITSFSPTGVNLSWSNYPVPTNYILERHDDGNSTFAALADLSYGNTNYSDNSVVANTRYTYRLTANNTTSTEIIVTTPASTTTQVPAQPTKLVASKIDSRSIVLNWSDNSTNETGFELKRNGPNDFSITKTITLNSNTTSYTDSDIQPNSTYQYWVRAFTNNVYSEYTAVLQVTSLNSSALAPPSAPSLLEGDNFTENSITIKWNDNSSNETGFIVKRALALEPNNNLSFTVDANDTAFVDNNLTPNTTYLYTVQAVNQAGNSAASNKKVASTLSFAETRRVKDGLIAYYNFGYDPFNIIRDLSGYGEPLDLKILQPLSVQWNEFNRLEIKSNTGLVSTVPAKKIVEAIKRTNQLTVECWIRPSEPFSSADSRIVSLNNNNNDIGFVINQYYNSNDTKSLNYGSRLSTASTDESGFPEIIPDRESTYINMVHFAFVHDSLGNESVFMNGEIAATGFRASSLNNWKDTYSLRLGSESDLSLPWTGTYYVMAIYNTALNSKQIKQNYLAGPCDSLLTDGMNYQISVYPNPASENVIIDISPDEFMDYIPATMIRMQDLTGRVYYQENLFNPNSQFLKTYDIHSLPKGLYIVQVISGHKSKSAKFIVQ